MACCLTPSTTSKEDFTAAVGLEVTIDLKGPADSGAKIVHIRYAGEEIDATPPFQFTVKKGAKMLVVLAEASKPGAPLQLVEVCNGGPPQIAARFNFDPRNPAKGFIVRGTPS